MFSKQDNYESIEESQDIETVVGPSIKVKGNFTGKGSIIINGQVEGNIQSNDTVFVGEEAKIIGSIDSTKAVINGEVNGNIKIKDCLELKTTARINGDIKCSVLSVEKGLVFNGKCSMSTEKNKIEEPEQEEEIEQD